MTRRAERAETSPQPQRGQSFGNRARGRPRCKPRSQGRDIPGAARGLERMQTNAYAVQGERQLRLDASCRGASAWRNGLPAGLARRSAGRCADCRASRTAGGLSGEAGWRVGRRGCGLSIVAAGKRPDANSNYANDDQRGDDPTGIVAPRHRIAARGHVRVIFMFHGGGLRWMISVNSFRGLLFRQRKPRQAEPTRRGSRSAWNYQLKSLEVRL
jgi:hypothetical protein